MSNRVYTVPISFTPGGGGSGTVTSVSMTGDGTVLNSTVTGSPVTTSGTLAPTLANAGANTVLGNATGSPAAPSYGQIVNGQITNGTIDLTAKVTGVLPPANGGAAKVSTAGQGYYCAPYGDASISTQSTTSGTLGSANQVRCFQFNLPYAITFTKININVTTTSSTNHEYIGVYNANGTSLLVQATFTLGAGTGALSTTVSSTTLTPGPYFLVRSADQTTSVLAASPTGSAAATALNVNSVRWGTSANSTSGGVLPSSLGTIASNTGINAPFVVFEP